MRTPKVMHVAPFAPPTQVVESGPAVGRAWICDPLPKLMTHNQVSRVQMYFAPVGKPRATRRDSYQPSRAIVAYRAWADDFRAAVRAQIGSPPPAERVVALNWEAEFPAPKSWSKRKREAAHKTLHRSAPDRDNIDKAILDALYGGSHASGAGDDRAIAAGVIRKRWTSNPMGSLEVWFFWNAEISP